MSTELTSPWLSRPGAVEAVGPDAGVAAHYGDPVREQRELAAGRAVVDLSNRGILTVTGPDRLSWIDSISSQHVAQLAPGESAETLILDPTGRIEHAVSVVDDGLSLWMLTEASDAPLLQSWLERMRFMMQVEIADRSSEFTGLASFADTVAAAAPNGVPLVWNDPWPTTVSGGWQYAQGEHPGASYALRVSLVARADLATIDAPGAGTLALEALRIAAWRPRLGAEVDEKSIPHELDWLRTAVHLSKGCYRGQETVAKVHNLGHPPRRLVMLHLDGSDAVLPSPGDEVAVPVAGGDDKVVGRITSAARHHELGPIALAVVKRTTDAAAELVVVTDDVRVAAAQELIVPPGAGATADIPRLPRLGAVKRPS